jgi:hypothetical protein
MIGLRALKKREFQHFWVIFDDGHLEDLNFDLRNNEIVRPGFIISLILASLKMLGVSKIPSQLWKFLNSQKTHFSNSILHL